MSEYKAHLFICTNSPDKEGKCGHKQSEEMRRHVKDSCTQAYGKTVRINASGCLGFCEKGITAVLYPEGKWFFNLTKHDGEKLIEEIKYSLEKNK